MTIESEQHSKKEDTRPSPHDQIHPNQAEEAEGAAETTMTSSDKRDPDPEKDVQTHKFVEEGILGTTASKIATDATEPAANPISQNHFGDEDNEYITGYKLYAALFGIICVFFLVLLDFSITATVSKDNVWNDCAPSALHRYPRRRI